MSRVVTAWAVDPVPTVLVVLVGVLYLSCFRTVVRTRRGGRPQAVRWGRLVSFMVGLLVLLVALDGPPDVLSDSTLSIHMFQHMLLQMVAAPLLLLGGPVSVLLRADPPWLRRRVLVAVLRSAPVRWLTHPVLALGLFCVVLVATHLTGFYELALEHENVHAFEHALYLATALLLWWPAIGVDPAPHRMSYAARVLYLFLMMPVPSLLGVAIADAGRVMYPYYVGQVSAWGTGPLADQHAAGTLLWVAAMFTAAPALTIVGWKWLDSDEREQARRDRLRVPAAQG
ncbi:MAG: cytochrome c oxidase assembly protein [Nocardioidaceae bacterium]